MARWELAIELDRQKDVPLYLQIARAITGDIRRGRLRPGDALPGSRTLARSLGVQRLTVVAAFDELAAEGWIVTRATRGAFVSPELPERPPRRFDSAVSERESVPQRLVIDLPSAPSVEMPYEVPPGGLLFAPNR